jgi:glucokinase
MADEHSAPDFALAIDIGGTKAAFSILNAAGQPLIPLEKHLVPFDAQHTADPARLIEIIAPYVAQAGQIPGRLRGIGLSCCGAVDHRSGVAVLVSNLHWRHMPIGEMVHQAFDLPVFTAADVRMAALAEAAWGAARGVRNFAWVTVGTGYGGHLFLDGKLYDGSHGCAGNFGHATFDELHGELCGCGRRGCFETYVAGPAIARAGQRAAESSESRFLQALAGERAITTRDVFDGEAGGDPAAHAIVENAIRLIAINLSGLVNTLDLDLLVMGGGVIKGSSDFVQRVSRRMRDFLMTEEAIRDLRVVEESFENSALVGAAADVFYRQGLITL